MRRRPLGRSGLEVSEIGLGCSGFWGDKRFSEKKAMAIVEKACHEGINFFDTGSNYSNFNAEPRLGRALRDLIEAEGRHHFVLSSKAGSTKGYAPTVEDDDLSSGDFSPDAIEASCLRSLRNLGTEYLDVFQLHGFDPKACTDELFKRLVSLRTRGLVRCIGVNTHFCRDLKTILKYPEVFDMVLTDCNVLQLDRLDIIDELAAKGIGVTVGTVLAQGFLIRNMLGSIRSGSFFYYLARAILKPTTRAFARHSGPMREALDSISDCTAVHAAFAYLLSYSNISSCVFGTTSLQNLQEVAGASGRTLAPESRRLIEATFAKLPVRFSR